MRNKILLFVAALLAAATYGVVQLSAKATIDSSRDCDKYAIMYCGALSQTEFQKKFNNDGKYKDHTKVYAAFGIKKEDATGMTVGVVWRDGRVTVGNKTVATGARDGARNLGGTPIAGTSGAAITSTSTFGTEGQTALIKMVNGVFKFAIITSCGNPVVAKPVLPPPPPKPPTGVCDRLTLTKVSRNQIKLAASAKVANGGKVISYTYNFGDGTSSTTPAPSATHTYPDTGKTYTITLTVKVQLGSVTKDVTATTCKTTFCVTPLPPAYTCEELSVTKIDRTTYRFGSRFALKNVTFKGVAYIVRDASGKEIARLTDPSSTYTQNAVGKYTVEAQGTVLVDGVAKTVSISAACKKPFEIEKIPETPVATCESLTVDKISDTSLTRNFTGRATASGGATITGYTIDFGDNSDQKITSAAQSVNATHAYAKAGSYTAVLTAHVKINGQDKDVTAEKCKVELKVVAEVCTTPSGETFPKGDARCTPCEVPGKEQFPKDSPECKPDCTTPGHENDKECVNCKTPGHENDAECVTCETPGHENDKDCVTCKTPGHENDSNCVTCETPGHENDTNCVTTPPELPKTGMGDGIMALFGAGSLIAAIGYYIASRRALLG